MTNIFIPSTEKQIVLVPKKAFDPKEESRAPLREFAMKAGYYKLASGQFDRTDQIEEGDFIFLGVKSSRRLATQIKRFRGNMFGVLMGKDVLADAMACAELEKGIQTDCQSLVKLGVGTCSMNFLAPTETPINATADIEGREIFTKYPFLLKKYLLSRGINAEITETDGADTTLNEYRADNSGLFAAFEVVESGTTAKKNNLQIVGRDNVVPELTPIDIQTDLFVLNINSQTNVTRDALQELGLAFESAKNNSQYASLEWNIPKSEIEKFSGMGMRSPSVMPLMPINGEEWVGLKIAVPEMYANRARRMILSMSGKDPIVTRGLTIDPNVENSEVLQVLPFTA